MDENTRTIDGLKRVVGPEENYFAHTSTPQGSDYIGSAATIIDGYNITYDSAYAATIDRVERLRELFTLSWFVDDNPSTLSDVLMISGNQTQDGTFYDQYGNVIDAASPSLTYVNQRSAEVNNPTHSTRDGVMHKGSDLDASLNPSLENGNPGGNDANWTDRYLDNGLDFADAITIAFEVPQDLNLTDVVVGRYDETSGEWVQAFPEECYVESGYSEHFSVYYRISEQHPEGGFEIDNCQQRYWGYHTDGRSVWGFLHSDGRFALINR